MIRTIASSPSRPGRPDLTPGTSYTVVAYDEALDEWTVDVPPPTAIDILAAFPPQQATAMATLAVGIASDAGTLWNLLLDMAPANTARPILDVITHHALEAGLALQENT